MMCSSTALQGFFMALFLLCSPVPHHGRPVDGLSTRMRRSVTHAQLMHDKGRTLQDFKRRMWLQELLDEVHTAEIRDLPPDLDPGAPVHSKPPGATKNLPLGVERAEEEEGGGGTNLPQETYKDGALKAPGKRKKKGRSGKRRDGENRKRRARSLHEAGSGLPLACWSLLRHF
ncbi:parathyroid hormone-like hormone a [Dunckerocampus dactyliophorus]|uniref:parathyroid hormone-like hormone a n=1 Tax=Dunckerocampus dactyliophorus TaxID=161453 RepID=UPI002406F5F3|nr:parathyroid hormone-like hormone a [Dunckerocampus dactyliophorus]XP_054625071.1 parathyroid hormone-like hormone a [Dunckerocampus dactyliophorus]